MGGVEETARGDGMMEMDDIVRLVFEDALKLQKEIRESYVRCIMADIKQRLSRGRAKKHVRRWKRWQVKRKS